MLPPAESYFSPSPDEEAIVAQEEQRTRVRARLAGSATPLALHGQQGGGGGGGGRRGYDGNGEHQQAVTPNYPTGRNGQRISPKNIPVDFGMEGGGGGSMASFRTASSSLAATPLTSSSSGKVGGSRTPSLRYNPGDMEKAVAAAYPAATTVGVFSCKMMELLAAAEQY